MESALSGTYALVALDKKSHSFAALTGRFLIRQQLVLKYRTPPLSTKYSIYIYIYIVISIIIRAIYKITEIVRVI